MKIDIHVHTKKTKSGDSEKRNIDPKTFSEIIKSTDIKVLAVTNHNHFDLEQYYNLVSVTEEVCQIWPGIELDVVENGNRGHLLVIVNPKNARPLSEKMSRLLQGTNEDKFEISINEVISEFEELDSIYIPHYYVKKPCITDEEIDVLYNLIKNKNRLIKEATNSISAGIYINHGHKSIYGSDVQDWDEYINIADKLPELRLPVESFEQFCLLLDKDEPTINTLLSQKRSDHIHIEPFGDSEPIELNIFNDINIIFGSKGTGKTEILRALSHYYNSIGHKTCVYESNREDLKESYDIEAKNFRIPLENIEDCSQEINSIKLISEEGITSISNYLNYFVSQNTNRRANSICIKDYQVQDISVYDRNLEEVNIVYNTVNQFNKFICQNITFNNILSDELFSELKDVLYKIDQEIRKDRENKYINYHSLSMFNELINAVNNEIAKKTGKPAKPKTTGFKLYASNRLRIERDLNKIITNINKSIPSSREFVGDLGMKGRLFCKTDMSIQDGSISNSKFCTVGNIKKTPQKEFVRYIKEMKNCIYSDSLFEKIADFINSLGNDVKSIHDLLLIHRYFAIDDMEYNPSSGESSMLLLHKELNEDKEIYLLDEPEKSLGNDYINDVIVPMLKEKARVGKKVIIATHDANIAVRTLPYNSIYRKHDINHYITYTGNPFSDNLLCIGDTNQLLQWKDVSMKTLEGGREAFGERGKIYGR